MKKILILTGSARPNNISDVFAKLTFNLLSKKSDVEAKIIEVAVLDLPYFDAPAPPASPHFKTTHKQVEKWRKMVKESDGIILSMPEYNHSMSAIQKNAIDWLYFEWVNKPTAVVTYGSNAGKFSLETFERVSGNVKMGVVKPFAQFKLGEEVAWDGNINDQKSIDRVITKTIEALLNYNS